jgi:hypothetical protein
MPSDKLKKISDRDVLEFAIITKYLRKMLLKYSTETNHLFGKSKRISKKILKISKDFEIYQSDCECYLWQKLEDMKYRGCFHKSLQDIFFNESDIDNNLINKFFIDLIDLNKNFQK